MKEWQEPTTLEITIDRLNYPEIYRQVMNEQKERKMTKDQKVLYATVNLVKRLARIAGRADVQSLVCELDEALTVKKSIPRLDEMWKQEYDK